jgi:hypothetical protein
LSATLKTSAVNPDRSGHSSAAAAARALLDRATGPAADCRDVPPMLPGSKVETCEAIDTDEDRHVERN